ncbi:MAG: IPT/TIG domain-containing protein, partial [Oscillospiraceae bacterium]
KNVKKILSVVLAVCMMLLLIPMRSDAATVAPMVEQRRYVDRKIVYEGTKTATMVLTGVPYVKKVEPNDVILVIDRSGSMHNHLENMKSAAKGFVNDLNLRNHRIGIVSYGSDAIGFEITDDRSKLLSYIDSILLEGGTRIDLGIEKAVELLQNKRQDVQGSIVLMTDGAQDYNVKDYELTAAEAAKNAGYYFYTVALAPENSTPDKNLRKMATSEADHYSRMYSDELSQVYDDLADKIGTCNAKDVELTLDVGSDFELIPDSVETNIPKPEINGSTLTWKFPQLSAGDSSVWYDFTPKAGTALGSYPTMSGTLSYTNYLGDRVVVNIPSVMVEVTEYPPEITSVSPVIYDGLTPTDITVYGKHFNPQAKLYLEGVEQTNITVTETSIKFTAPAVNAVKSLEIRVVNPDGQDDYARLNAGPNPTIFSITPDTAPCNTVTNVEIKGMDFNGNKLTTQVTVGGRKCEVGSVSATKITAKFPALPVGTYDVMVKNADGGVNVLPQAYTTYDPDANKTGPQIFSITPNTVEEKTTTLVEINGNGFLGNKLTLKVTVNGTPATVKSVSASKVSVYVPALDAGTYDVVVTNKDGTSTTVAGGITYEAKPAPAPVPPVVTSITPNEGEQNKTHNVEIIGSGFSGNKLTLIVTVGGNPATVGSVSASKVTATVPALAAGTYDVVVKNPDGGTVTVTDGFKYVDTNANKPGPQITSITPDKVEEKKTTNVEIFGSGFK